MNLAMFGFDSVLLLPEGASGKKKNMVAIADFGGHVIPSVSVVNQNKCSNVKLLYSILPRY